MEVFASDKSGIALVFPGQGSQHVGMGKDIYQASPAARRVFQEAEEVLGIGLRELCFEGPEDVLTDTINAQPAILTTSIACLAALAERSESLGMARRASFVAGHSLGEYSALVAAGAIDFRDAVLLVRERGRLMKEAGVKFPGGMAAVLGLDNAILGQVCEEASKHGIVCIANYNAPGQTVISGEDKALSEAIQLAQKAGAKRAIRLAVSIASHSPLMSEAANQFIEAVERCKISEAGVPLVANISASPITSAAEIKQELAAQLCGAVLWEQSVMGLVEKGTTTFLELGPGQVLAGLVRRISQNARAMSLNDTKGLESAAAIWS